MIFINQKKLIYLFGVIAILTLVLSGCQYYFDTYNISGMVVDADGKGIEGVIIYFDGPYSPVVTNTEGRWAQDNLRGTVQVTPKKYGWQFTPEFREVETENRYVNFTGIPTSKYKASGQIRTSSGEGIPRVEVQFSNGLDSVFSGVNGYWEKSGLNGEVIITPVLEGWVFNPPNKPVESSEDDVDFIGEPSPEYVFYGASGRVIDENGDGIPGVEIQFKRDGVVFWMTFTDNDGNWQVDEYLWGTVRIEPQGGNYRPPFLEIEGERTDIIFRKE